MNKRPALGIRILERERLGNRSYSLYAKNGSEYAVLVNYLFFGLCLRSKHFQFNDRDQAEAVFERMVKRGERFRFNARLLQRRSYDF